MPKKILIVCDGRSGGIFDYSRILYKKLAKDFNVEFLSPGAGLLDRLKLYKKITMKLMGKNELIVDIQGLMWPMNLLILPLLKLKHHKFVFEAHDDPLTKRTKYRPLFIRRIILNNANLIISHSRYCEKILKRLGLRNVKYIPIGANIENLIPIPQLEARKKLGIDEQDSVILFFGLLTPEKCLDTLLRSIPLVKQHVKNVKLIIKVQENPAWEKYQRIIDELKIEETVLKIFRFVPTDEMAVYFGACDIVVTPYREITNSGIPLLAYSFKRPVVASDIGAFREMVKNGKNGLLVDKESPESLAEGICLLIKDKKLCRMYGRTGHEMLNTEFSWERIKKKYERLFMFCR